jgi:thioredoxin reductase (NADPH)
LRAEGHLRIVGLEDGSEVTSRAVVIATGAAYRRLGVPELEALTGCGVFYGAVAEAQALDGEEVFVVGGGNSAGQAAVHLAKHAAHVTILVRSHSLAASMSAYLVNEIGHRVNIDVRYGVEIVGGGGDGHLEWLDLRDLQSGVVETVPAAALFVLIGARPFTAWLSDSVARDEWGYVLTGARCGIATCDAPAEFANVDAQLEAPRPPLPLETSLSGVFAVGDVRQGSAKRVASAVGDGSVCIGLTHEFLSSRGSADGAARASAVRSR